MPPGSISDTSMICSVMNLISKIAISVKYIVNTFNISRAGDYPP